MKTNGNGQIYADAAFYKRISECVAARDIMESLKGLRDYGAVLAEARALASMFAPEIDKSVDVPWFKLDCKGAETPRLTISTHVREAEAA
jgi:hypothetical protein